MEDLGEGTRVMPTWILKFKCACVCVRDGCVCVRLVGLCV